MSPIQTPSTITEPLESVTIPQVGPGTFSVRDGQGREYVRAASDRDVEFIVGGALGTHTVFHLDPDGCILDTASFRVDCRTQIDDDGERFGRLLEILYYTMFTWWQGGSGINSIRLNGKLYKYYVSWLRDHVHALKGMKYFDPDIKQSESYREFSTKGSVLRKMSLSEFQKKMNEALLTLSDKHRAVVTMHDVQGMPHAEIAAVMKCSEGTVRSRLFYARKQLQVELAEFVE